MVIQDNLSPENYIDKMFDDTFRVLRNMQIAFHFLDKKYDEKNTNTISIKKLEYAKIIWSPYKKNHELKLESIQRITNKMVPDLEDLTHEERLKEMQLTTLK